MAITRVHGPDKGYVAYGSTSLAYSLANTPTEGDAKS